MRLFLSNPQLAEIEPLVLVDMPGFESPLDLHNQAIMEYINKGVHYIVLTSVEDGTMTRSMVRQLEDIQEYKRDFTFFLSKSDLRSPEDVEQVKLQLEDIIEEQFDLQKVVTPIDTNGGNSLKHILQQIQPEELFRKLFIDILKDNYHTISEALNTTVSSLSKNKEENEQEIQALEESIEKIIRQKEEMIEEAHNRYSDVNVNRIIDNIGRELSNSIDELVSVTKSGGQDALSSSVSEIVRHSLVSNINESMAEIANDITGSLAINLSNNSANFALDDEFISKISNSSRMLLDRTQSGLENFLDKSKDNQKLYKSLTTVLAVTTSVVAPMVEILIIFLPEILNGVMGFFQESKQEESIRNAILTNLIPTTKRKLRETLPNVFNSQVEEMIIDISTQYEKEITIKKDTITSSQEEIKAKIGNIEEALEKYKSVQEKITQLANSTIFQ